MRDPSYLVRFGHLESVIDGDPDLTPDPGAIALIRQLTVSEYEGLRTDLAAGVRAAAAELLAHRQWRTQLESLRWDEQTVVAVGDSMTADLQSWARILDEALRTHHGGRGGVKNLAVDGDTTAGVLARLPAILAERPDQVLIMIGTNDAQGLAGGTVPWLSNSETQRNLATIGAALTDAGAELTWMAPPRIRCAEIRSHWYLRDFPVGWSAERHEEKRGLVLDQPGRAYDVATAIDDEAGSFLDGLHPSLEGHRRIAMELVNAMSAVSQPQRDPVT